MSRSRRQHTEPPHCRCGYCEPTDTRSRHAVESAAIADSNTGYLHPEELRLIAHDAGCCPTCPHDVD